MKFETKSEYKQRRFGWEGALLLGVGLAVHAMLFLALTDPGVGAKNLAERQKVMDSQRMQKAIAQNQAEKVGSPIVLQQVVIVGKRLVPAQSESASVREGSDAAGTKPSMVKASIPSSKAAGSPQVAEERAVSTGDPVQ